jgi:MFS family permease
MESVELLAVTSTRRPDDVIEVEALAVTSTSNRRPGDRLPGDTGGDDDWKKLTLLAAAAIFICYADRSNISTAIIPMAAQFGWDKVAEGGVLSAFFYGYALTQLLGGALADKYGGKPVLTAVRRCSSNRCFQLVMYRCSPQDPPHEVLVLTALRLRSSIMFGNEPTRLAWCFVFGRMTTVTWMIPGLTPRAFWRGRWRHS